MLNGLGSGADLERTGQLGRRRLDGRDQAGDESRSYCRNECESDDAPIERPVRPMDLWQ